MLLLPPLPCNRPVVGADGDSGEWTGEKRRRHLGPSLPSDTGLVADTRISSSSSDAPEELVPDLEDSIMNYTELPVYNEDELINYALLLSERRRIPVICGELDLEPQRELYERLVRCRLKAHETTVECKSTLRGPAFLENAVSVDDLHFHVELFFRQLDEEEGSTIEWYFESKSKFEDLGEDYHRLVLKNYLPNKCFVYWNWELYSSLFTTYEMDKDYVEFVKEMSSKLKCLKSWFGHPEKLDMWDAMERRGLLKAYKIAVKYTHMNSELASIAYEEYIQRLQFDYLCREGKADLFFEIWKHVTNGQLTVEAALAKLLHENLFPRHKNLMQCALEKNMWCGMEEQYNSCVEGIPGDVSEDEAKELIRAVVWKFHERRKPLHKYMERKMEIARNIGLANCLT